MITQKRLNEVLEYDPETGFFTWKIPNRKNQIGKKAGHLRKDGRDVIMLDGKSYYSHRLAWLAIYGVMPQLIDHKNMDVRDNRISNLRIACKSTNSCNRPLNVQNKSGVKGISWSSQSQKWAASFKFLGKNYHVGLFKDIQDAKNALVKKREEIQGEFAHHG